MREGRGGLRRKEPRLKLKRLEQHLLLLHQRHAWYCGERADCTHSSSVTREPLLLLLLGVPPLLLLLLLLIGKIAELLLLRDLLLLLSLLFHCLRRLALPASRACAC